MENNIAFTRIDRQRVNQGLDPKPAEEKEYLILLDSLDENDEPIQLYEWVVGRSNAYKYIYDRMEDVYLSTSYVLVETGKKFQYSLATAYQFMKYCHDNFFPDPDVVIESYLREDEDFDDSEISSQFLQDGFNINYDGMNVAVNTKGNAESNRQILGI